MCGGSGLCGSRSFEVAKFPSCGVYESVFEICGVYGFDFHLVF